jgi:hypothetical protein
MGLYRIGLAKLLLVSIEIVNGAAGFSQYWSA